MRIVRSVGIVLLTVFIAGCATLISGVTQKVTFQSNPSGADVIVNGTLVGVTPITVNVKRQKGTIIRIRKIGFREQTFVLRDEVESWFWGNAVFLTYGLISSSTDSATGASVEYSPDQYYTTLDAEKAPPNEVTMGALGDSKNKIIRFILVNYNTLVAELNIGSGEHIDALLELMEIAPHQRAAALREIKRLYVENTEIPAFAEAVARQEIIPGNSVINGIDKSNPSPEAVHSVRPARDINKTQSAGGAPVNDDNQPLTGGESGLNIHIAIQVEDDPESGSFILGNGDGIVQKGEAFELCVKLTNPATNKLSKLSCSIEFPPDTPIKVYSDTFQEVAELGSASTVTLKYNCTVPLGAVIDKKIECQGTIRHDATEVMQRFSVVIPTDAAKK